MIRCPQQDGQMGAGIMPAPRAPMAVMPQQIPQQVPQQIPQQGQQVYQQGQQQWRPSGGQNRFQNWRSPFVSAMGCYRCGDLNHFVRDCPVPQQIMGQQVMRPQMVPQQVRPQAMPQGVVVQQGVVQGGMQQVQLQQCGVEVQQVGEVMQGGVDGMCKN